MISRQEQKKLPLIYSCSGCSNVAQLANDMAVKINTEGIAEMSCIVGVGGKVRSLVKTAQSDRSIIVIDGCPLQCAKACLANIDIEPTAHFTLTDFDLKKQSNSKLHLDDEIEIFEAIKEEIKKVSKRL